MLLSLQLEMFKSYVVLLKFRKAVALDTVQLSVLLEDEDADIIWYKLPLGLQLTEMVFMLKDMLSVVGRVPVMKKI